MQTKKNPDNCGFVKKKTTDYKARITEREGRVHNITGLTITAALTTVENKLSDASNFVKKTIYDA